MIHDFPTGGLNHPFVRTRGRRSRRVSVWNFGVPRGIELSKGGIVIHDFSIGSESLIIEGTHGERSRRVRVRGLEGPVNIDHGNREKLDTRFPDHHRGVGHRRRTKDKCRRVNPSLKSTPSGIANQKSGIRGNSGSQQCERQFPNGIIPDKSKKGVEWIFHWASWIYKTRSHEFRTRDLARSDFPIKQGEIIRRVLWGYKVPIRDLKRILALRA
jgi:hypothetical protein